MTVETAYRPSEADIKPFKRNEVKYRVLRWWVEHLPANIEVKGLENIQKQGSFLTKDGM